MKIGIIGHGKMGYNIALNLRNHGYEVIAQDQNPEVVAAIGKEPGISGEKTLKAVCQAFDNDRRVIWLMIPAGPPVDEVLEQISDLLNPGDIVSDGGNSNYKNSRRRYELLKTKKLNFLDCGTSGGTSGALNGACTMVGGDREVFDYCEQIFKDISIENGYLYCGAAGSGHFTKMVHNGIEYGMMQSIAEGFEVLQQSDYWAVLVASQQEIQTAGQLTDMPIGRADDEAAFRAMREVESRGWFAREHEEEFSFFYYWDTPSEMKVVHGRGMGRLRKNGRRGLPHRAIALVNSGCECTGESPREDADYKMEEKIIWRL